MKVSDGQSLIDIAIQGSGSVESVVLIAIANGQSLTDELNAGQSIAVSKIANQKIADYFADRGLIPATYSLEVTESESSGAFTSYRIATVLDPSLVSVMDNQSVIDLAIQACGSVEAALTFALLNGLAVTDELIAGDKFTKPAVSDQDIADYFTNKGIKPATSHNFTDSSSEITKEEGIEFWAIEYDFIVS